MIAYDILVQTIADWRAGVRPSAPSLPPIPSGAPEMVEEFESGVVDIDDGQYGEAEYVAEDEAQYAAEGEAQYAAEGEAQYAAEGEAQYAAEGEAQYAAAEGEAEYVAEGEAQYAAEGEAQYAAEGEYAQAPPAESAPQTYQEDDEEDQY